MILKLKSITLPKIIPALFVLSIATSCTKKGTSPSYDSANVPGTWHITQDYRDTNRNQKMDANELMPASWTDDKQWIFNTNGTVTVNYLSGGSNTYNWSFISNKSSIKLTDTGLGIRVYYYLVEGLTPTTMELKDTTNAVNGGTIWLFFSK
ncbi:MAG: hypothetical protein P4L41_07335 [Flavipsychrobacter sp.]|nr:hypothetical protein [Flavipsychrobacter sp.]